MSIASCISNALRCAMTLNNSVKSSIRISSQMKRMFHRHPLLWGLMSLLMLTSFVILQMSVEKIVFLGNVSHSDFDWLRKSIYLSSYVRHDNKTEILFPSIVVADRQREKIVCFVISAPENQKARSAIRQTWGKVIRPLFILGLSDKTTMKIVENEAKVFDDIIVEDFVDSYLNLTLKTAFTMKHFLNYYNTSKYFLKIDDDIFLNTKNLYSFLKRDDHPRNSIIGRKGLSLKPHRDRENKWYIPYWLYRNDTFPDYIDGPAYLIPGHMVEKLYFTSLKLPFFTLEDVFFTGIVGHKTLKYNLHNNKKFRMRPLPYHHECVHERFITVHETSPTVMLDLWSRMQRKYSCGPLDKFMSSMVDKYDLHSWLSDL